MTDETPDTGNPVLDLLVFASVSALAITSAIVVGQALTERFRRKDKEDSVEVER